MLSHRIRASLVAQLVKKPAMQETWVRSLGWEEPWRRERLPTPVSWPGEFHGLYSSWGRKESDTTEGLRHTHGLSPHKWFPLLFTFGSLFDCHGLWKVFSDLHISHRNLPVLQPPHLPSLLRNTWSHCSILKTGLNF